MDKNDKTETHFYGDKMTIVRCLFVDNVIPAFIIIASAMHIAHCPITIKDNGSTVFDLQA